MKELRDLKICIIWSILEVERRVQVLSFMAHWLYAWRNQRRIFASKWNVSTIATGIQQQNAWILFSLLNRSEFPKCIFCTWTHLEMTTKSLRKEIAFIAIMSRPYFRTFYKGRQNLRHFQEGLLKNLVPDSIRKQFRLLILENCCTSHNKAALQHAWVQQATTSLLLLLESPRDNKKRDKKSESRSMPPFDNWTLL